MRNVSFQPRRRPSPLLGLGRMQLSPLAPAAGSRAAGSYRRALSNIAPGLLPPYRRELGPSFTQARIDNNQPLAVSGIRATKSKSRKKSSRKRTRKSTKKRASGRIVCKQQTIRLPSGKRVRRTVCRNSLGQITKKKSKRRTTRRK